jgi:hypothetical protein
VGTDDEGAPGLMCAQRGHLAHMWVRRPGLGVEVVAVVPHDNQPQVIHGRIDSSASTDDRRRGTASSPSVEDAQPPSIPLTRAEVGGQHHRVDTQNTESTLHVLNISVVGNDNDGTAV